MGRYLFVIRKNLRRNLRRTALTVASTGISVFLVGSLIAVHAMLFSGETRDESRSRLITRHKVSLTQALPNYYRSQIEAIDGVDLAVPMNWFGGTYIDQKPEHMFARFATDQERIFDLYSEWTVPPEQLDAFKRDRQGLAIGRSIVDRLNLSIGQRITITGDIYPFDAELTIRAIFEGPDDQQSFFHLKYLEESVVPELGTTVGVFAIGLRSPDDATAVAAAVDEQFRNSPEPTKTETEKAFQMAFVSQLGNVKLFLLSIGAAIAFTMLMVSANTVAMSVRERTREVGVLKTLGFTRQWILRLVLGEATAISLLGGVLGVGLTVALPSILEASDAGTYLELWGGLNLPMWGIAACFGIALLVGLGSSVVPATIAARTHIVDALRHTG